MSQEKWFRNMVSTYRRAAKRDKDKAVIDEIEDLNKQMSRSLRLYGAATAGDKAKHEAYVKEAKARGIS